MMAAAVDDCVSVTVGPPRKILKTGTSEVECEQKGELSSFKDVNVVKILQDRPESKCMFIQAKIGAGDADAVIIVEKTPFNAATIQQILSVKTSLSTQHKNDIYGTYSGYPDAKLNGIKATVIYPATEKHILKYTEQPCYTVSESWGDYKNITLPHLSEQNLKLQWVYNILEKKAEVDRILFEDPDPSTGFLLLPDMKWEADMNIENMYLIAICYRRDVMSLRSLTAEHLPLLKNILNKGKKAIEERFGVPSNKLRIYLHYQPSYYHLHVHFTHIKFDAPGTNVCKAHLLTDVIENIELTNDYYQRKTLTFIIKENDPLYKKFKEKSDINST